MSNVLTLAVEVFPTPTSLSHLRRASYDNKYVFFCELLAEIVTLRPFAYQFVCAAEALNVSAYHVCSASFDESAQSTYLLFHRGKNLFALHWLMMPLDNVNVCQEDISQQQTGCIGYFCWWRFGVSEITHMLEGSDENSINIGIAGLVGVLINRNWNCFWMDRED